MKILSQVTQPTTIFKFPKLSLNVLIQFLRVLFILIIISLVERLLFWEFIYKATGCREEKREWGKEERVRGSDRASETGERWLVCARKGNTWSQAAAMVDRFIYFVRRKHSRGAWEFPSSPFQFSNLLLVRNPEKPFCWWISKHMPLNLSVITRDSHSSLHNFFIATLLAVRRFWLLTSASWIIDDFNFFFCFFLLTRTFANRRSSSDAFGIGWRFLLRTLGCRMWFVINVDDGEAIMSLLQSMKISCRSFALLLFKLSFPFASIEPILRFCLIFFLYFSAELAKVFLLLFRVLARNHSILCRWCQH